MFNIDNFEIECPECGNKFKADCDTCGYSISDGFCEWNMRHDDADSCMDSKYRWKPKKKQ